MTNRRDLEEIADLKPSRFERRLARNELKMTDARDASDNAGFGVLGRVLIGLLSVLGVAAAMIPTLLYFAIVMTPLFLLYTCMSHF